MSDIIETQNQSPDFVRLKSELLKRVVRIELYEDPYFPASNEILFPKTSSNAGQTDISWRRPGQLSSTPTLIKNIPNYSEQFLEGPFTPFWFPLIMTVLKEKNLFELVLPNFSSQDTFNQDPLLITPTSMSYCGAFQFAFRRGCDVEYVIIDDRLPSRINCELLSAHTSDRDEYLPALLEKAYAKFLGGYYNLEKETFFTALMDFTGGVVESLAPQISKKLTDVEIASFFKNVADLSGDSFALCQINMSEQMDADSDLIHKSKKIPYQIFLITGYTESLPEPPEGLMSDLVNTISDSRSTLVPMVRLRSLMNFKENVSIEKYILHKWKKCTTLIKKKYGVEYNNGKENWITVDSLASISQNVLIYNMLNRNSILAFAKKQLYWNFFSFESFWHKNGPRGSLESIKDEFLNNNQYLLSVTDEEGCSVKIILTNIQKYIETGANTIKLKDETEIGLVVLKVERNRRYRVHNLKYTLKQNVQVDFQMGRYLIISANLDRGSYVIIPWISQGAGIKFSLQIFSTTSNCEVTYLDLDIPKREYCITCQLKQTALETQNKFKSFYEGPVEDISSSPQGKSSMSELDVCEDCKAKYPKRATRISVIEARNIPISANLYLPNFYFKITCENESYESKMVRSTRSPHWNENFVFYRTTHEDSETTIQIFCESRLGFKTSIFGYTFPEKKLRDKCQMSIPLRVSTDSESEETKDSKLIIEVENFFPSEFSMA